MYKSPYEILGVSEFSSKDEILLAYQILKKKYQEDRFCEGEKGNDAARMLEQIDIAYADIMKIKQEEETKNSYGNIYGEVEEALKNGNLELAQIKLESFSMRNAQWHYLQSVLFYKKNFLLESKKQLELALHMDPNNSKYKEAHKKLNDNINQTQNATQNPNGQTNNYSNYQGNQNNGSNYNNQMGGNREANCCMNLICADCCCECMGGDLIACC